MDKKIGSGIRPGMLSEIFDWSDLDLLSEVLKMTEHAGLTCFFTD
jgi:hypothetical protein